MKVILKKDFQNLGEAADIHLPLTDYTAWDDNQRHTDMETARKWFDFLKRNAVLD